MTPSFAGRIAGLTLCCAAVLAASSAPAHAVTASITGDNGSAVPLTGGMALRHMAPDITLAFSPDEKSYSAKVVGPAGAVSSGSDNCRNTDNASPERVAYQGNGTYMLVLKAAADPGSCTSATPQSIPFTINAGVTISPPGRQLLLTRAPNQVTATRYAIPVSSNPGADSYELRYAAGATVHPDGSLSSPQGARDVRSSTSTPEVSFLRPGRYTLVARIKSSRSDVASPWSPRLDVTVKAPFDLFAPRLTDSRGPTYTVAARVRERTAKGRVRIALGKGRNPTRFRRLGTARIGRGGAFRLRFRLAATGHHVVRITYRGNRTVHRGSERYPVRFFSFG